MGPQTALPKTDIQ
jgi:transcription initiation factor TFIID subunit 7